MSELEATWCDKSMMKPQGIIDIGDVGTDLESEPGKAELENSVHCLSRGEGKYPWQGKRGQFRGATAVSG